MIMNLSIPLLHVQEYSETFYNKLITIKIEIQKFLLVKTIATHRALQTFHQQAFNIIVW